MKPISSSPAPSRRRFGVVLLACLATVTVAEAAVLVEFTGSVDSFNPGPLTPESPIDGSFSIDVGVASTGANMNRQFVGAVDNLSISIVDRNLGHLVFSGQDGTLTQFCQVNPATTPPNDPLTPCGPGTRFASVSVGQSSGGVAGAAGGFDFESLFIDFRGGGLFANPFDLINGVSRDEQVDDFSYARMVLRFNGTSFGLERSLDTIRFSAIPEPGTALLFGLGVVFMVSGFREARRF